MKEAGPNKTDRLSQPAWFVSGEAGGAEFGALMDAMLRLQQSVAAANAPDELVAAAARQLSQVSDSLDAWRVGEEERPFGRRWDLPGRGQCMTPRLVIREREADRILATFQLGPYYVGRNNAAHGGVAPLIFDEIMGVLANQDMRVVHRTAYLNTNYRAILPVDREIELACWLSREEGRKRYISAEMRLDGVVLTDAEGLFIALNPGQP